MTRSQTDEPLVVLMESGLLAADSRAATLPPVPIQRGMVVQTREGQCVGHVAAVVLDQEQQTVTHLLLLREQPPPTYRLLPVALIEQVRNDAIRLRMDQPLVARLPLWHNV